MKIPMLLAMMLAGTLSAAELVRSVPAPVSEDPAKPAYATGWTLTVRDGALYAEKHIVRTLRFIVR